MRTGVVSRALDGSGAAANACRRRAATKRRPNQTAPPVAMPMSARMTRRSRIGSISRPPPAEAARIAHPGQQAQPPQLIVDKAAGAETNREDDTGEHEHNEINRPAPHAR